MNVFSGGGGGEVGALLKFLYSARPGPVTGGGRVRVHHVRKSTTSIFMYYDSDCIPST